MIASRIYHLLRTSIISGVSLDHHIGINMTEITETYTMGYNLCLTQASTRSTTATVIWSIWSTTAIWTKPKLWWRSKVCPAPLKSAFFWSPPGYALFHFYVFHCLNSHSIRQLRDQILTSAPTCLSDSECETNDGPGIQTMMLRYNIHARIPRLWMWNVSSRELLLSISLLEMLNVYEEVSMKI